MFPPQQHPEIVEVRGTDHSQVLLFSWGNNKRRMGPWGLNWKLATNGMWQVWKVSLAVGSRDSAVTWGAVPLWWLL